MAKYTIAVRPAGEHAILVTWRKWGWYSRRYHDASLIPYNLATYCLLIPNATYTGFTEHMYQLDEQQLAECKSVPGEKVTRKGGLTYFTFNLSTQGNRINA